MKEEKKKRHKEDDGNLSLVKKKRSDDSPSGSTSGVGGGGGGGSSSSSSKGGRGGSSHVPMSERQQFALIKQMETAEEGTGGVGGISGGGGGGGSTPLRSGGSSSLGDRSERGIVGSSGGDAHHGGGSGGGGMQRERGGSDQQQLHSQQQQQQMQQQASAYDKKLNKRNCTGETMLIQMAKKGELSSIKRLVQEGANINEQDYAGWTALHESCIRNYPRVTRYLLRHGANVHLRGLHGDTALHDATKNGSHKVIAALLKYEADPYAANDEGIRPVDLATNDKILRLLRGNNNGGNSGGIGAGGRGDSTGSCSGGGSLGGGGGSGLGGGTAPVAADEESNSSDSSMSEAGNSDIDHQRGDDGNSQSSEGGPRSPIRSDNYKRIGSGGPSDISSGRVKDPYAFEDDESEDPGRGMEEPGSPTMTSPIKLRLNKEGQYMLSDQPTSGDTNKTTDPDSDTPAGGGSVTGSEAVDSTPVATAMSTVTCGDSSSTSVTAPKLEPMKPVADLEDVSEDQEDDMEEEEEDEDDDISSVTSRSKDVGGSATAAGDERGGERRDGGGKDSQSEEGSGGEADHMPHQKVPPLRIKLSGSESGGTGGNGDEAATGGGTSGGSASGEQQDKEGGDRGRESDVKIEPGEDQQQGQGAQQQSQHQQQSTSQRSYRGGRTLRSHTAAQREKEEKERVDVAPIKKRKLRSRADPHSSDHHSSSGGGGAGTSGSGGGGSGSGGSGGACGGPSTSESGAPKEKSYRMDPPENPYDKAALLSRQMNEMLNRLVNIQPKAPNGYQDYLMVTRDYLQGSKLNSPFKKRSVPSDLVDKRELADLFKEQEEERFSQALKHLSEREHLRLCAEQEVIRSQTRASLALNGQSRPFSFCSIISYKDYTYLPPIKGFDLSKEEENVRDRFTPRTFKGWISDTKDKFEKEKNKLRYRQLHESESLMMVQKLDWEMKLKELLIHDFRAEIFKTIPTEHVPQIAVPDDFPLFPADPV